MRKYVGLITLALAAIASACHGSPQAGEADYLEDGKARLRRKDYARALLQFRNAVQLAPQDAEAHYQLGLASVEAGDLSMGISGIRRATELNPKLYSAQVSYSQLMLTSANPAVLAGARKRLEMVVAAKPGDAVAPVASVAWTTLGFAAWKPGHSGEAEQRFGLALRKDPQHLDASTALAKLLVARKDAAGAESTLGDGLRALGRCAARARGLECRRFEGRSGSARGPGRPANAHGNRGAQPMKNVAQALVPAGPAPLPVRASAVRLRGHSL